MTNSNLYCLLQCTLHNLEIYLERGKKKNLINLLPLWKMDLVNRVFQAGTIDKNIEMYTTL